MDSIQQILQKYWGHESFRPLQEDIIHAVMEGKDTLALLPTGGGKSICFQVPALAQDGICLVISPLIALMKDQVENLKKKGIGALQVYSGMSFIEVKKTLQNAAFGNYKFLYVSPERLETNLFLEFLPSMKISLIAVDEAHCISQWGYDFRPSYSRIATLREQLPKVPVLALTASATKEVQDDICVQLGFKKDHQRFQPSFERPELSYSVFNVSSKQNKLVEILTNVAGQGIVYCKSRKQTKEIAEWLTLNGISADHYHAGLSNEERNKKQEAWINNKIRVIVSTNAFGMGIDKADVRTVVHHSIPDCLENYYQEAGRAGRDGKRAYAVLLYTTKESDDLQSQADIRYPSADEIKKVYSAVMNFLQIAAGSGEGTSHDFDIASFSEAFKINIFTANYVLKTLEQESILSYNEAFFKPSTIVFTVERTQLEDVEKLHPALEPIIKGLLRSYEGIFDFPSIVLETQLAKFVKMNIEVVKRSLLQLRQLGIIDYTPQKEKPQLTLLQNRMYTDSFKIDLGNYHKRKANFERRIKAIGNYVNSTTICRSQFIASYFNDTAAKKCGICDNCINEKNSTLTTQELDSIMEHIFQLVKIAPQPMEELLKRSTSIKKEKLWKVINYLQSEKKLATNGNGDIIFYEDISI
jgi:ATP-dependent DNA helicase RecQ